MFIGSSSEDGMSAIPAAKIPIVMIARVHHAPEVRARRNRRMDCILTR